MTIIEMLECSKCHGHDFLVMCSGGGGCDSCGYGGGSVTIICNKCNVEVYSE